MSAPKKGQFGEPWEVLPVDENTAEVGIRYPHEVESIPHVRRIVSCVNALDGRDPEKLKAVLDAAKQSIEGLEFLAQAYSPHDCPKDWCGACEMEALRDILRAALRDFGEEV